MNMEIRNDRQFDRFILRCNGPQRATIARIGYAQYGRGAVLIDLTVETAPGHTIATYLPHAALVARIQGSTDADVLKRFLDDLHTYDPAQTLLIVVERQGAHWHPYRLDLAALATLAPSTSTHVSAA